MIRIRTDKAHQGFKKSNGQTKPRQVWSPLSLPYQCNNSFLLSPLSILSTRKAPPRHPPLLNYLKPSFLLLSTECYSVYTHWRPHFELCCGAAKEWLPQAGARRRCCGRCPVRSLHIHPMLWYELVSCLR